MTKHITNKEIIFRKKGNRSVRDWLKRNHDLSRFLFNLLTSIKNYKGSLYLVGGMVRDILEGVEEISDIDMMVCGIDFDNFEKILKSMNCKLLGIKNVIQAGKHFPVYRVFVKWKSDPIDIACARSEESTGLGHRNFKVTTKSVSAYEDSGRRDFTFNAIFFRLCISMNRLTGRLVDYQKGLKALQCRTIKAVGNPKLRFLEDPLRMLRAIRQKNQRKGFVIEQQTWDALVEQMPKLLHTISGERISNELIKSFRANPFGTFIDLVECGAMKLLLPELWEKLFLYDMTLKKFSLIRKKTNLSAEFSLTCLLSEVAFSNNEHIQDIIHRLYLPNQKNLLLLLQSLVSLANIKKIEYPYAIIEELINGVNSVEEIILLYETHKKAHEEERINLSEVWLLTKSIPKIVSGYDLNKFGIEQGPIMKNTLRYLRDAQLKNGIMDKDELMKLI